MKGAVMGYRDDLAFAAEYLVKEQYGEQADAHAIVEAAGDEESLFALYRNLVNVREPLPADEAFLAAQDRMLKTRIERAGVTRASSLPRVSSDTRLSIWRGDITTLEADAIVNAANSQMLGCWVPGHHCIDNAIHTYAGVQLRAECARIMREQGHEEPTGQAKVTAAYNLPATWIIHTVGPIAAGHPSDSDQALLANSYRCCLKTATGLDAKSVAFCCIGTGVFGFPQEEAARIAVRTVREWLDESDSDLHVVFNVFGQKDEEIYHAILGD